MSALSPLPRLFSAHPLFCWINFLMLLQK
jgi:hypothetical protein